MPGFKKTLLFCFLIVAVLTGVFFVFLGNLKKINKPEFVSIVKAAATCCGVDPALMGSECTIDTNPCSMGGNYIGKTIDVNVSTASVVQINLTSDINFSNTNIDFRNKSVLPTASKEIFINGRATASTSARSISLTGGGISYPLIGLTIDLSVPNGVTGDGGVLDFSGAGSTTFGSGSVLKIYTQASGSGSTGGIVRALFTSDILFGASSIIKTGNFTIAGVDGGYVNLIGSGSISMEGSSNLITTSSSRKAGNVKIIGSGYYKGGIHANSCEGFGACGQTGGTIDLKDLGNFYSPDCTSVSLEAKNGGTIDWLGNGFFDMSGTTTTGAGGLLKMIGGTLSDCSCCDPGEGAPGNFCTGGACRSQLGINNGTVNFIGVNCDETNSMAACSGGPQIPTQTLNLSATAGTGQISLNWNAPANNGGSPITNYKVYRSSPTNGSYALLAAGGCSGLGDVLACTEIGLTNGITYYYKVSAVNAIGEGFQSNEANATPIAPGFISVNANVHGFAWSNNIGWVSFNNRNCDMDNDGYSEAALSGCPVVGTFMQGYGVNLDLSGTNNLSGYAWSENIGWIKFDPVGPYPVCPITTCPAIAGGNPNYSAKYDPVSKKIKGWARSCSVFSAGCSGILKPSSETGGWDGWILLGPIDMDGVDDKGVWVDNSLNPTEFKGWAWGSEVVGLISFNHFNCDTDNDGMADVVGCAGDSIPNYNVYIDNFNTAPVVTPNIPSLPDWCSSHPPSIILSWVFNDLEDIADQTAYQITVTRNDGTMYNSDKVIGLPGNSTAITGAAINLSIPNFIDYGYDYTWTIQVWDSGDLPDPAGPKAGVPFSTPLHAYPQAGFTYTLPSPNVGLPVNFTDSSIAYGGATIDKWTWTFGDGNSSIINPPAVIGDTSNIYGAAGSYVVNLTVQDSTSPAQGGPCTCSLSQTINLTGADLQWEEVTP